MRVAIVGGGVVGLTTALALREELRDSRITVYAESFDDTVSHVAAGIFRVAPYYSGPSETIVKRWVRDSYEYYDDIRKSSEAASAGVTNISGYIFSNSPKAVENRLMEEVVPLYRKVTNDEFQVVGGDWKYGTFFKTILTQCTLYLPWMRQKLNDAGVEFVQRKINSLAELADYDVIMNCTGFGARDLCNDHRMVALRGHVLKVKAPWIKTFFYGETDTYVIPGFDGIVTLGGSRSFGAERLSICPHESTAIRERCNELLSSLKRAQVVDEKVGLRPHRDGGVRVELTNLSSALSTTKVVHNYGHGGYGVCTAPGTAKYAVDLVKDVQRSSSRL